MAQQDSEAVIDILYLYSNPYPEKNLLLQLKNRNYRISEYLISDRTQLQSYDADLILLAPLPTEALSLIRELRDIHPDLPLLILVTEEQAELTCQALQAGADDYILIPALENSNALFALRLALQKYAHLHQARLEGRKVGLHKTDFLSDLQSLLITKLEPGSFLPSESESLYDQGEILINNKIIIPDHLPGINFIDSRFFLSMDRRTYLLILFNFFRNNCQISQTIEGLYYNEDWNTLNYILDNLKGSSASLGAKMVMQNADNLEQACRENQKQRPAVKLLEDLIRALEQALQSILILMKEGISSVKIYVPSHQFPPPPALFNRFKEALKKYDPIGSKKCYTEIREYLNPEWQCRLQQPLRQYDFPKAAYIVKELEG